MGFQSATLVYYLFSVADRFSMDGLFRLCNYKLCNTIDSPNVVCIYRQATESLPVLGNYSETFMFHIGSDHYYT